MNKEALLEINRLKDFIPIGAYIFAEAAHAGKFRADNKTPYVFHLYEVAHQLDKFGIKDDFHFAIAILHDILEKTNVNKSMLLNIFGKKITDEIVKITFDESKMSEEKYYFNNKNNVIKLADHICNTRFFMNNKIKDATKYYLKGKVIVDNFRNQSPYKEEIETIEKELNLKI